MKRRKLFLAGPALVAFGTLSGLVRLARAEPEVSPLQEPPKVAPVAPPETAEPPKVAPGTSPEPVEPPKVAPGGTAEPEEPPKEAPGGTTEPDDPPEVDPDDTPEPEEPPNEPVDDVPTDVDAPTEGSPPGPAPASNAIDQAVPPSAPSPSSAKKNQSRIKSTKAKSNLKHQPAQIEANNNLQESTVVSFGQSAALSGPQASNGKEIRDGIAAAFMGAAKREPGKKTRFELITQDDGGNPARCAQNVIKLIDRNVTALIGLTSGAGAEAAIPIIKQNEIALLGAASGNMEIRDAAPEWTFHVRAGYDLEFQRIASYIKSLGMRRVGVIYFRSTSAANIAAMTHALKNLDPITVEVAEIEGDTTTLTPPLAKLVAAQLDCIFFIAPAAPIIALTALLRREKYVGIFYASSLAGQPLIDMLKARPQSIIISTVVPRPTSLGLSIVTQCKKDLAALGTGTKLGLASLEGYIAGRVAIAATLNALKAGPLTRKSMRDALASLNTDLGGYKVNFTEGKPQGSKYVDLITIDRYGRVVA